MKPWVPRARLLTHSAPILYVYWGACTVGRRPTTHTPKLPIGDLWHRAAVYESIEERVRLLDHRGRLKLARELLFLVIRVRLVSLELGARLGRFLDRLVLIHEPSLAAA